jgi:hypothetical protein
VIATAMSARPVVTDVDERQILVRVDRGGIRTGEGELRYQLERKDGHSLARAPELLVLLGELQDRGLIDSELSFWLTHRGRERLAELAGDGGEG